MASHRQRLQRVLCESLHIESTLLDPTTSGGTIDSAFQSSTLAGPIRHILPIALAELTRVAYRAPARQVRCTNPLGLH